jgi:hypothetical protein
LRCPVCGLRTLAAPLVRTVKTKPAIANIKSEYLFIVKFITSIQRPRDWHMLHFSLFFSGTPLLQ